MGRGNKAGKIWVNKYTYLKDVKGQKADKKVTVKGHRRSAPGGAKGSQKK